MITVVGLENREKLVKLDTKKLKKFAGSDSNIVWIDMEQPTQDDFKTLASVFNFHPLCIEDCQAFSQLPKVDDYGDYLFLVMHRIFFDKAANAIELKELDMFLGKNYLITVHMYESDTVKELRDKIEANVQLFAQGADFLMYAIMDKVVDKYFPVLDTIDDQIDELEDLVVNSGAAPDIAAKAMAVRRNIAELKKTAGPQREVINRLARHESPLVSQRTSIYFRDVYDNVMRVYSMLEAERDLIASTFEAYLSSMNNRLNEVMKQLTIIATIFLPLTFITGIYGMNFQFMPELSSQLGYPAVLLVMLAVGLSFYFYFRRKGWA